MKLPKLSFKSILLYYSTFLSTILISGGFYTARSGREVISNVLFLPIVIFLWMILIKHRRKKPKSEILNPKQYQMTKIQNTKQYDLEERTLKFAKRTIEFTKKLPKTIANNEVWNIGICNLRFV